MLKGLGCWALAWGMPPEDPVSTSTLSPYTKPDKLSTKSKPMPFVVVVSSGVGT